MSLLLHVDQGSGIIGAIGFIISAVSSGIIRSKLKKEAREATIQSTPGLGTAPATLVMVPQLSAAGHADCMTMY